MVYKNYYIRLIIRIIFLLLTCILFSYAILKVNYVYTIALLGLLIILQTILLIRFLNQTNIFLERFLLYIKENDSTINFSTTLKDTPFRELAYYFNEINGVIRDAKIEKENQHLFLHYIFNHVDIGLMAVDQNLDVQLINQSALKLLNLKALNNLKSLQSKYKILFKTLAEINVNEKKVLPVKINNKNLQLSLKVAQFKLLDKKIRLISLQDIKPELDYKEVESWQKLNRVLTHEIMNSVSPIIGLTKNISKRLKNADDSNITIVKETINQTIQSINIIEERSIGLDNFVKKFKSIASEIKPDPQIIDANELFEDLTLFMYDSFQDHDIEFKHIVENDKFELFADRKLIEQVIINLLKNSVEAFSNQENKRIKLIARANENQQKVIEVIDNGDGVSEDKVDLIFTPFFTTKDSGSGIGLSLSKNILKQHGYNIDVRSVPNVETVFTLYF